MTSHDIGWIPGKKVECLDQGAVQWLRWDSSYPGRSLLVPRPKSSLVHCSNPSLSSTLQGSTTLRNTIFLSEQKKQRYFRPCVRYWVTEPTCSPAMTVMSVGSRRNRCCLPTLPWINISRAVTVVTNAQRLLIFGSWISLDLKLSSLS